MLGPVGLRQDDDAAHDRRLRAADRRARSGSRARTSRKVPPYKRNVNTVFQQYALFPHLTVVDNVAFGLAVQEGRRSRDRDSASREMLEVVRLADFARAQARAALRWPAAARRAGPGARQLPERAAARRAARRARPQAAPGDAARAEAHPARGRHHLRVRHPRPGRGAHDERPHRGDERGPGRADRHARGDLRRARDRCSSPGSSAMANLLPGHGHGDRRWRRPRPAWPTAPSSTARRSRASRAGTRPRFMIRPERMHLCGRRARTGSVPTVDRPRVPGARSCGSSCGRPTASIARRARRTRRRSAHAACRATGCRVVWEHDGGRLLRRSERVAATAADPVDALA